MPSPPRLSLKERLGYAMKAARMTFAGFGGSTTVPFGSTGYPWTNWLPGSTTDWDSLAGDLWRNEVVSIVIGWLGDNYCQADFEVAERNGTVWEPIEDHPLTTLMRRPNPAYGASALWQATLTSELVAGNAYWMKARPQDEEAAVRGIRRPPVELWYLPHWQVIPQWPKDGGQFISHYVYRVPGQADQRLEKEDVIHFRRGLNLYNLRSGDAPLGPMSRSVCGDNEATSYTAAILANAGVPNLAISADGQGVIIPDDEAEKLQKAFSQKFGGDNRGRALVCTRSMKVAPIGWSPEDMALEKLPIRFEVRLCAAARIPPMVVGLNAGDSQRTYANMGEAQEWAWEDGIKPMQSRHAETLDMALLPDFGDPKKQRCRYCYDSVSALQEDENDKATRAVSLFTGGIITRAQARAHIGMEATPEDEVYMVSKGAELVPAEHAGVQHLTEQAEQKEQMQEQMQQQLGQGAAPESSGDAGSAFARQQGQMPNGNGRPVGTR